MKLTSILLCVTFLQVSANSYSQERLSLHFREVNLEKIFHFITRKSAYSFLYQNNIIPDRKIAIEVDDMPLPEIMDRLLDGTKLSYKILSNKLIVITGKGVQVEDTTVTGRVLSPENEPLPGVSIRVKNSSLGTVTDPSGRFSLTVPSGAVLEISYIGFETKEVAVHGQEKLQISLQPSASGLNEVVVVGYGTERKANVIGSVSQINAEDIGDRQVTQLSNAITGQMPGVTVIQRSGRPGFSGGNINIRGVGSFGADANPLILVDGVPVNSFNDIDPNDVESISVLKDASSAAIYGARAANGVILVTTKSGKEGKIRVRYSGYIGVQKPTEFPQPVPSWEFARLYNEAIGQEAYSPEDIQKFKDGSDPDHFPNSDFINSTFSGNGIQTGHNISVSGGTEKNQYLLSLGYLNQHGIVPENYYNRYSLRLNLNSQISSRLRLTGRVSGIRTNVHEPAPPATLDFDDMVNIISQSVRIPAIYAGRLSDGSFGVGHNQQGTPVSWLESASFFQSRDLDMNVNLRLDWDVIDDLTLSVVGAYDEYNAANKRFLASQALNANITLGPSELTQNDSYAAYKTLQGLAEYKKQISQHQFGVLLGYSFEEQRNENMSGSRDKFPGNDLTQLNVGAPDNQKAGGTANEWAIQSVFGRVKYNFANKYLLEGVVRYDGSSRFPPDRKYALFPSLAAGWRLSEEKFIKDHISWIQDLKLKASIGVLGNQNISNYPYQNTLTTFNPDRPAQSYGYPFGGVINSGVARATIVDSTLHWESTRTEDAGIEMSVLNGKLNFSVTYFDRYTYDILYSPGTSVSNVLGFSLSQINTGKLRNSGWEFTLGHSNKAGELTYNVRANFSIIRNRVTDLGVGNIKQPNGMTGNGSDLFIGYPMSNNANALYYGYVADGLFTDEADTKNWVDESRVNADPQPGDIRYKDISGPDGKPDGKVDPTYDRVVLGSTIPKYTFGLSLGLNYKGFDLSALLQGVGGVKGRLTNYAGYAFYNTATIQQWMADEHWSPENPNRYAGYPRLELIPNSGTPNTVLSSYWILDASYVKVRNIQLGYSLPAALTKKMDIDRLRFYISAENAFSWNRYREGWDPEINTNGPYYPILANYTFGVNLSF